MKNIAATLLLITITTANTANAGNLTAPALEQAVIADTAVAGSSSSGVSIVALFSLLLVGTVLSN